MARIDWVKRRLDNWASWKAREQAGGLGFSASSAFLGNLPTDRYRESRIPIDEVEASVTDEAVEQLRFERPQLYITVVRIYVEGMGVRETSRRSGIAESTVKGHLDQADHVLSLWFRERERKQQAAREAYRGSFTA